jgi:spore coat protein CotH
MPEDLRRTVHGIARSPGLVVVVALVLLAAPACAQVAINEIFYNAPDDRDDVQWIELHNTADRPVDLGGWTLDEGKLHTFPAGTTIDAGSYLVVALEPDAVREVYDVAALGPLQRPLRRSGERLELRDARRSVIDAVRYGDRAPWPVSADGYSASLERICPRAPGDAAENWVASPLPAGPRGPGGTPGRRNAGFSRVLPPVIASVSLSPEDPRPDQPLDVEAEMKDAAGIREARLLYWVVEDGIEGEETAVPMEKDAATGRFRARIPPQRAGTLVRYRVRAANDAGAERLHPAEHDLRPTLSAFVHEPWKLGRVQLGSIIRAGAGRPADAARGRRGRGGFGGFFRGFGPRPDSDVTPPARGSSAFIHVDPRSGKTAVFDHLRITDRGGRGFIIHFHKDHTLAGMTAASIIHEGQERFLLAEMLAYDVYRRAGNAAPLSDFVRLSVDGQPVGHHLMVERVNRSFLGRNEVDDGGNLYKLRWYGSGIVGQHEKKTHPRSGHEDLLAVVDLLQRTGGDEEWRVIEEHFNVRQVATYFAVNAVLSHWDGYFNNHYVYHDVAGTGRWEMYPWDQDKTWGHYDGIGDDEVFFDMPLTFGMEGDVPPGGAGGRRGRGGFGLFGGGPFGGGPSWWRPGGHFSSSLLANPRFRRVYLQRIREILETVYTKEVYFPIIDELGKRLGEDLGLSDLLDGEGEESAPRRLERNLESLRTHLLERRRFLLGEAELVAAGKEAAADPERKEEGR